MRTPCILLITLLLSACASAAPANGGDTPQAFDDTLAAHRALRLDCRSDADCTIKDIGNCCGHYPACVHVDSPADPAAVAAECAERGLAGICGYPVIEGCVCRTERCQPRSGANEAGPVK